MCVSGMPILVVPTADQVTVRRCCTGSAKGCRSLFSSVLLSAHTLFILCLHKQSSQTEHNHLYNPSLTPFASGAHMNVTATPCLQLITAYLFAKDPQP